MRFVQEFDEPTETLSLQTTEPLHDEQVLQIVQQLEPIQPNEPEPIQPVLVSDQPIFNNFDSILNQQNFDYPAQYDTTTTNEVTQSVATMEQPAQNYSFQLLPIASEPTTISEVTPMLETPIEETIFQQGYEVVSDPYVKENLEVNDLEPKTPPSETVTVVVTSAETGEKVAVQTTPENVQTVVTAAQVADNTIKAQTTTATTATEKTADQTQDLLFGYPSESVYLFGAIAGIGLLVGLSFLSSED